MFKKSINNQITLFSIVVTVSFICSVMILTYLSFRSQTFYEFEIAHTDRIISDNLLSDWGIDEINAIIFNSSKLAEIQLINRYWERYNILFTILSITGIFFCLVLNIGVKIIMNRIFTTTNQFVQKRDYNNIAPNTLNNIPKEVLTLVQTLIQSEQKSIGMAEQNQRFRGFASHELRNELAILLSLAEQTNYQETLVINQIHHLKTLVDDLLLLSYYPDKMQFHQTDVLLVLATLVDQAIDKEAIIFTLPDDVVDFSIMATDTLITRCFFNLLDNALTYRDPDSHVSINIRQEEMAIVVTIKNHCQQANFDIIDGHGIGLILVKHIVATLQGYYYYEINKQMVTTIVSLPIALS